MFLSICYMKIFTKLKNLFNINKNLFKSLAMRLLKWYNV